MADDASTALEATEAAGGEADGGGGTEGKKVDAGPEAKEADSAAKKVDGGEAKDAGCSGAKEAGAGDAEIGEAKSMDTGEVSTEAKDADWAPCAEDSEPPAKRPRGAEDASACHQGATASEADGLACAEDSEPPAKRARGAEVLGLSPQSAAGASDQLTFGAAGSRERLHEERLALEAEEAKHLGKPPMNGVPSLQLRIARIAKASVDVIFNPSSESPHEAVVRAADADHCSWASELIRVVLQERTEGFASCAAVEGAGASGAVVSEHDRGGTCLTELILPSNSPFTPAQLTQLGTDCNVLLVRSADSAAEASSKNRLAILGTRHWRLLAQLQLAQTLRASGPKGEEPDLGADAARALEPDMDWGVDRFPDEGPIDMESCIYKYRPRGMKTIMPACGAVLGFVNEAAMLGGSTEERKRARAVMTLLHKANAFSIPSAVRHAEELRWEVEEHTTEIDVPAHAAMSVVGAKFELEETFGVILMRVGTDAEVAKQLKDRDDAAARASAAEGTTSEASGPAAAGKALEAGMAVEVQYKGTWYSGKVAKVGDDDNVTVEVDGKQYDVKEADVRKVQKEAAKEEEAKDKKDDDDDEDDWGGWNKASSAEPEEAKKEVAKAEALVEVFYNGQTYKGTLLKESDGKATVNVNGKEYEVPMADVHKLSGQEKEAPAAPAPAGPAVGDMVEAKYRDQWYAGEVIAKGSDGKLTVKVDGKEYEMEASDVREKPDLKDEEPKAKAPRVDGGAAAAEEASAEGKAEEKDGETKAEKETAPEAKEEEGVQEKAVVDTAVVKEETTPKPKDTVSFLIIGHDSWRRELARLRAMRMVDLVLPGHFEERLMQLYLAEHSNDEAVATEVLVLEQDKARQYAAAAHRVAKAATCGVEVIGLAAALHGDAKARRRARRAFSWVLTQHGDVTRPVHVVDSDLGEDMTVVQMRHEERHRARLQHLLPLLESETETLILPRAKSPALGDVVEVMKDGRWQIGFEFVQTEDREDATAEPQARVIQKATGEDLTVPLSHVRSAALVVDRTSSNVDVLIFAGGDESGSFKGGHRQGGTGGRTRRLIAASWLMGLADPDPERRLRLASALQKQPFFSPGVAGRPLRPVPPSGPPPPGFEMLRGSQIRPNMLGPPQGPELGGGLPMIPVMQPPPGSGVRPAFVTRGPRSRGLNPLQLGAFRPRGLQMPFGPSLAAGAGTGPLSAGAAAAAGGGGPGGLSAGTPTQMLVHIPGQPRPVLIQAMLPAQQAVTGGQQPVVGLGQPVAAADGAQLNPEGYPLRPGRNHCKMWLSKGACSYGSVCQFDHPDRTGGDGASGSRSGWGRGGGGGGGGAGAAAGAQWGAQQPPGPVLEVGSTVEVWYRDKWWDGVMVALADGGNKVTVKVDSKVYEMGAKDVRAKSAAGSGGGCGAGSSDPTAGPSGAGSSSASTSHGGGSSGGPAPGSTVEVKYWGKWYTGEMLGPSSGGKVKVRIDGKDYDVSQEDVRPASQGDANGSSSSQAAAGGQSGGRDSGWPSSQNSWQSSGSSWRQESKWGADSPERPGAVAGSPREAAGPPAAVAKAPVEGSGGSRAPEAGAKPPSKPEAAGAKPAKQPAPPGDGKWQRLESKTRPGCFYYWHSSSGAFREEPPEPWTRRQSRRDPNVFYYWNSETGQTSSQKPVL